MQLHSCKDLVKSFIYIFANYDIILLACDLKIWACSLNETHQDKHNDYNTYWQLHISQNIILYIASYKFFTVRKPKSTIFHIHGNKMVFVEKANYCMDISL